jgi:manganese transport protein
VSVYEIARAAFMPGQELKRIGVALETSENDGRTLAEGVALAKAYKAELILMHVVEGVGGQWYGAQTNDAESRHDAEYVESLAVALRDKIPAEEIPVVRAALGYGDVVRELVRLAEQEQLSLMVLGGHGHWGLSDVWRGQTISGVRHSLKIPVLAVRAAASPATG